MAIVGTAATMKDILERILAYLPGYFLDVGRLFASPKEFIGSKDLESDSEFVSSVLFSAVTTVILFTLNIPISTETGDLWTRLAVKCANASISAILLGVCVLGGFAAVGRKGQAKPIFIITIYYSTMMNIITATFQLLSIGFWKTYAPELFEKYQKLDKVYQGNLSRLLIDWWPEIRNQPDVYVVVVSIALIIIGALAAFIWLFVGWGSFRKLSGLPRWKSCIAFVIVVVLVVPISIVAYLISVATRGEIE